LLNKAFVVDSVLPSRRADVGGQPEAQQRRSARKIDDGPDEVIPVVVGELNNGSSHFREISAAQISSVLVGRINLLALLHRRDKFPTLGAAVLKDSPHF